MIKGLDLSRRNTRIDITTLPGKGLGFAFVKATQGNTIIDKYFQSYWQAAKPIRGAGFKIGAYCFFDPRIDGILQADFYLALGFDFSLPGVLPPVVDVEDLVVFAQDGSIDHVATEAANKWVAANWRLCLQRLNDFLAHIKEKTGKDCLIYTYNNYPKEYFPGANFPNNPMWLSSLQATCPHRYDTGALPEFWQYTYQLAGTDEDGDYFTGTQDDLNKMANILAS